MFGIEEITTYRTPDGKIFDYKEDAIAHNFLLMEKDAKFTIYIEINGERKIITSLQDANSYEILEYGNVIHIENQEALELLKAYYDEYGYSAPNEIGWNFFDEAWLTLDQMRASIEETYSYLYPFKVSLSFKE